MHTYIRACKFAFAMEYIYAFLYNYNYAMNWTDTFFTLLIIETLLKLRYLVDVPTSLSNIKGKIMARGNNEMAKI